MLDFVRLFMGFFRSFRSASSGMWSRNITVLGMGLPGRWRFCRRLPLLVLLATGLTTDEIWAIISTPQWGRTGFDFAGTPEAACRGRFVGLVNHSNQTLIANQELALAA